MKKCPVCKEHTIPYIWIFFGKSKHKYGRCFKCSNCGKNVKKSQWLLIDIILYNDLTYFTLFILFTITLSKFIQNFLVVLLGSIGLMVIYFMAISFFSPLREAEESYCRGDMTKIGAIFALIAIPTIIFLTVYILLYKPLVLGEPPFP